MLYILIFVALLGIYTYVNQKKNISAIKRNGIKTTGVIIENNELSANSARRLGAAMQVLERVLGPNISITDHTYDFRGYPSRTYASITDAGAEAGISRLYGGIHYIYQYRFSYGA